MFGAFTMSHPGSLQAGRGASAAALCRGAGASPGRGRGGEGSAYGAKPWENHGKTMGKPWDNGGFVWDLMGCTIW